MQFNSINLSFGFFSSFTLYTIFLFPFSKKGQWKKPGSKALDSIFKQHSWFIFKKMFINKLNIYLDNHAHAYFVYTRRLYIAYEIPCNKNVHWDGIKKSKYKNEKAQTHTHITSHENGFDLKCKAIYQSQYERFLFDSDSISEAVVRANKMAMQYQRSKGRVS